LQSTKFFTIDLSKTKGKIRCPNCKVEISPDDETEEVYIILEPVMKGDLLEKIILQCNKCGSQIHLIGFELLHKLK